MVGARRHGLCRLYRSSTCSGAVLGNLFVGGRSKDRILDGNSLADAAEQDRGCGVAAAARAVRTPEMLPLKAMVHASCVWELHASGEGSMFWCGLMEAAS